MEKQDEGEIAGKSERRRRKEGGRARRTKGRVGRETERERVRVWREDRAIDRITGFKSRTEREMARDKGKKRERERERAFRVEKSRKTSQIEKINTLNSTL